MPHIKLRHIVIRGGKSHAKVEKATAEFTALDTNKKG
jgi:hypothetical protein